MRAFRSSRRRADSPCGSTVGWACRAGLCLAPGGTGCDAGTACLSTFCTDGVCCELPSCGAYRGATTGRCLESCAHGADCAAGYPCDAGQRCVPAGPEARGDEGCACELTATDSTRRPQAGAAAWLAIVVVALPMRRRNRARPGCGVARSDAQAEDLAKGEE